jgi:hypothetical protein
MKHCEVKQTHLMQNAQSYGQAKKTLYIYIYIFGVHFQRLEFWWATSCREYKILEKLV